MAKAAKLSTSASPARDLWPGIEQAINKPAVPVRTGWHAGWVQAAAVVLLIAGSSGLTYFTMRGERQSTLSPVVQTQALMVEPASASFGSRYNLGPGYLDARRTLSSSLDEHLARLSPEARAAVRESIKTIQDAIRDINNALVEDPGSTLLQELLINAYRDELSVMKQVDGIADAAMYREDI